VRFALRLAEKKRQQVHAIEFPFMLHGGASGGESRWQDIQLDDKSIIGLVTRQLPWPRDEARNSASAFESRAFRSAKRCVHCAADRRAFHRGTAGVAEIDNQRVVQQLLGF